MLQPLCKDTVLGSVVEPEPIFLMAGAESRSGSGCIFWQAEKESLVLVSKHDLRAGADPILSEPEWLQDLGLPELEPPKKVGAPQHWSSVCFALSWEGI